MEGARTSGSQTSGLDGAVTSAQALARMEGIEGKRNRGRLETKPRGEGAGMRYEQERGDSRGGKKKERRSKHLPHLECDLGSCNQTGLRQVNKRGKKNRLNARERRRNERGIIPRWKG